MNPMSPAEPTAIPCDQVRAHIRARSFRYDAEDGPGRVGLEPEFLAYRVDEHGAPRGRLPLAGARELVRAAGSDLFLPQDERSGAKGAFSLRRGGQVTFEPGGQIEHSTAPHATAGAALADVEDFLARLALAADERGIAIAALGCDAWSERESVPLAFDHWRYRSMQAFFDRRGVEGRIMMRHTASVQVNLDLGPRGVAEERYRLANLLTPIVSASFATSPARGAAASLPGAGSARARVWQAMDPSRCGFPRELEFEAYVDAALAAELMLVRDRVDGVVHDARLATPGSTLRGWLRGNDPVLGAPPATFDDIDYHLTTLFLEVRPRGFLEIRAADALPSAWRAAPVVFLCGLLYDATARGAALAELESWATRLREMWVRAGRHGLGDEELAVRAAAVWQLALAGARRLPADYFRTVDLERAERFAERYVLRRRTLLEEWDPLFGESSAAALAVCRERAPR